jgi:hypothetical protein
MPETVVIKIFYVGFIEHRKLILFIEEFDRTILKVTEYV